MSQVRKPNTTPLTRRSALAGLSLLVGATIVPIAVDAATKLDGDAELLALAVQFEPLYADWIEFMTADHAYLAKLEALLAPRISARLGDGPYSEDEYVAARLAAVDEIDQDVLDDGYEDLPWDDLHDRLYPKCDEILSRVATTREGVALQVKAAICAEMDAWINEDTAEHRRISALVESVCQFVGVQFPRFEGADSGASSS
jgi:hypothetical protein